MDEPGLSADLLGVFDEPDKVALGADQQDIYELGVQAFAELEKLAKNILLYGGEHQSIQRFQARFFDSVTELIGPRESAEISVGPYEFLLFDRKVMENTNPERNFIYKLYLDGVRRIIFRRGLVIEELNQLVNVLLTDWEDPKLFEDDSVTLLWSSDFSYIRYTTLDNFAEDIRTDDQNVYTVPAVISRVRTKGQFSAGEEAATGTLSRRLKRVDLSAARMSTEDLSACGEVYFAMDELEFATLKRALHTTSREKLEKFIEILFKVHLIQELSEEDRRGRITALFDRLADLLLVHHDVGDLERLLRTIRRLTGPEDRVIRENVLAIEHIVEHWSAQPFVDRITYRLNDAEFRFKPSVVAICGLLSRRATPHIARAAGSVHDRAVRTQLLDIVSEKIIGQQRFVADLLRDADREHAHDLLQILVSVEDPDDLYYAIQVAMENGDAAVRLEAVSLIPLSRLEQYQPILFLALNDFTKSVRSKAIHLLARLATPLVTRRILALIESDRFKAFELDEKRRFHAAAALTGADVSYWTDKFSTSGLLGTKQAEQDRHCAAIALGIRLHRPAMKDFEKEIKRRFKTPLVVDAAAWAMQHIECSREDRTKQLYDLFFYGTLTSKEQEVDNG